MAPLLLSTGRQGLGERHLLPGAFPQPLPRALSLCCLLTSMGLLEGRMHVPCGSPTAPPSHDRRSIQVGTEEIPAKRWALKSSITGETSPRAQDPCGMLS